MRGAPDHHCDHLIDPHREDEEEEGARVAAEADGPVEHSRPAEGGDDGAGDFREELRDDVGDDAVVGVWWWWWGGGGGNGGG